MQQKPGLYVPQLNSESGLCLTAANWQDVGLKTASFSLEQLLFKPGLPELTTVEDLKKYLVCAGNLIINASTLPALKNESYTLISPYDGNRLHLSFSDLVQLMLHLKPDAVLFPKNSITEFAAHASTWNSQIQPFFYEQDSDLLSLIIEHGIYCFAEDYATQEALIEKLNTWQPAPTYVLANPEFDFFFLTNQPNCTYIQSDRPAFLGANGKVFSEHGVLDLTSTEFAMQFEPISEACSCPTCAQNLTKSYLHHLIHHTPFLCQRFLIQHNAYFSFTFG